MTTNKTCKAVASASGERCKRKPYKEEYCKQHYKQLHPTIAEEAVALAGKKTENAEVMGYEDPRPSMPSSPVFEKFEVAKRIAHTLANSNLVPDAYRGRPNDVFVAINMGAELGMEPFQAIQSIAVIEGKPCLYGDGLIGVVRASPKCLWIKESLSSDGKTATCETQRKDDPQTISATYSWADAVQAGIESKYNWKKHPKRMLQMRARAYCLRDAYPDLLKGLGVMEEMVDHELTPPPIVNYALPEPQEQPQTALDIPAPTLAEIERRINQCDTMAELLEAGQLAKSLTNENDIKTARVTYNRARKLIQEQSNA